MGLSAFNRARRIAAEKAKDESDLTNHDLKELRAAAKERKIEGYVKMTKEQLIEALEAAPETKE